jgi:hypothetical protein
MLEKPTPHTVSWLAPGAKLDQLPVRHPAIRASLVPRLLADDGFGRHRPNAIATASSSVFSDA